MKRVFLWSADNWQCREQLPPSSLISFTRRPNTGGTVIGWGELVTNPEHLVSCGAVFRSDNHNHNQSPLQCSFLKNSITLFEILLWEYVHFYNVWTTVVWRKPGQNDAPWTLDHICQPRTKLSTLSSFGPRCDKRTDRPACVDSRMAAVEYWSETLLPAKLNNWQRIDQRIIAPRCAPLVWPGILDTTLSIFTLHLSVCPFFVHGSIILMRCVYRGTWKGDQTWNANSWWPLFFVRWFINQNEPYANKRNGIMITMFDVPGKLLSIKSCLLLFV